MSLSENNISQLNALENLLAYQPTWLSRKFINAPNRMLALFTGNQYGKTATVAHQYVLRIMGIHPVPAKNVLYFKCSDNHKFSIKTRPENNICPECGEKIIIHKRVTKTLRFCSSTLPGDKGESSNSGTSAEVKNTIYPALKKWLPSFLIKNDITFRNPAIMIKDPNYGMEFGDLIYDDGSDIVIEFVSYHQAVQNTAGTQRLSVWCDEEPPYDFYKEQMPRLLSENGDFILSLTPANYITWTYDDLFERAKVTYRSKSICDFLSTEDNKVEQIERFDSILDIAIFQAATDDNPTLELEVIDDMFSIYDDPDDVAIRRYGIFKQVSGRIFKDFEYNTHFIDSSKYFGDSVPHSWTHGRGIDYHPQTPWACVMMAVSPTDEVFVWGELTLSPEKYTTREICKELALKGKDYQFRLNLIDPFSAATKKDSITVLDDINRSFLQLKNEGIGTGGYWQTWDTKGEKGRDEIRKRLKNSLHVGKPFNNIIVKNGMKEHLPTLWVMNDCKQTAQSMRQWRWEEWSDPKSRHEKEQKNIAMQKWSHLMMCIEALFKHPGFRYHNRSQHNERQVGYFRTRA